MSVGRTVYRKDGQEWVILKDGEEVGRGKTLEEAKCSAGSDRS